MNDPEPDKCLMRKRLACDLLVLDSKVVTTWADFEIGIIGSLGSIHRREIRTLG